MKAFISELPKAELHVHIEGTMEPDLLFELSNRNSIPLSYDIQESRRKRVNYDGLQDFLDQYYDACKVLICEQDFYELAMGYYQKASENNIKHTEIFFDPQAHTKRGVAFRTIIEGFHRAQEEANKIGISSKFIMCILRDLSEEEAIKTINEAADYAELIGGLGLDSDEVGHPPSKFFRAFRLAASLGLCGKNGKCIVSHASSEADPSYVIDALATLKVKRIDHGVRAIEDTFLCKFLATAKIPLTVCPNSNNMCQVKSRFFPNRNIVKELMDLGIVVTINSDDPAFFGGYLNDNYQTFVDELSGVPDIEIKQTLAQIAKNGFMASFLDQSEKQRHVDAIDDLLRSN